MYTRRYRFKDLSTGNEGTKEFTGEDNEVFSAGSIACRKIKDEAARSLVAYWNHKRKGLWQYYLLDTSTANK